MAFKLCLEQRDDGNEKMELCPDCNQEIGTIKIYGEIDAREVITIFILENY